MPKTKSNSGARKRFKRTSSGNIVYKHVGMQHNLRKRTKKQKRRLNRPVLVSKADKPRMLALLS